MVDLQCIDPARMNRIIDFILLGLTFYLSCWLLSVGNGIELFVQALGYASVVLFFVNLSLRFFASHYPSLTGVTRQIICNASGILCATLFFLLIVIVVSANAGIYVALLFSGMMAFFVLGTLLPLVHKHEL
jgi:hypothetical protein